MTAMSTAQFTSVAPPAAPQAAPPPGFGSSFLVHLDRPALNRRYRRILVLNTVVVAVVVVCLLVFGWLADSSGLSTLTLLPFLVILLAQGLQIALICHLWGSRGAIGEPLAFDEAGFALQLGEGRLTAPWDAVQSITLRSLLGGQVLCLRLHPGVTGAGPGESTDLGRRPLGRLVRRGVLVGSVGIQEELSQVVAAAESLSRRPLLVR